MAKGHKVKYDENEDENENKHDSDSDSDNDNENHSFILHKNLCLQEKIIRIKEAQIRGAVPCMW